jgi:ATP-dependent DNA helicase RecG
MAILESWEIDEIVEGKDLEAKKAAGRDGQGQLPKDFWSSYSAMANTDGGIILLGVQETEDGRLQVSGILNVKKVQSELWNGLNNRDTVSCNILSNRDVAVSNIHGKEIIQVEIPRATRFQMPVFLTKNPFGNTYRRNFDGDYRCDEETVKRMFADQFEDVRDGKLLQGFNFTDLHVPTFSAYRNAFKAVRPDHPWIDLGDVEFLRSIGGWTEDRETARS